MPIKAQTYTFHCCFKTGARLPGYLGSTLRGALGWSLKKTSCALRRQQCDTCLLHEQCAYAWIFETEKYQDGDGGCINARPHPFIVIPDEESAGIKKHGDEFNFSLLLFDHGNDLLPQIIYAVQLMGEAGIGSGRRQGLGRFQLLKVTTNEQCIFSIEVPILKKNKNVSQIKLEKRPSDAINSIKITLHTPLRLKHGNKLNRDLPFHVLIRTALRRISALEGAYGCGEPDIDYKGMVDRARYVEVSNSSICWKKLFRYSNRQRKKVSLSGLGGSITYTGAITEFFPLLHYCERVNIGKQTVFGLGRISILANQE